MILSESSSPTLSPDFRQITVASEHRGKMTSSPQKDTSRSPSRSPTTKSSHGRRHLLGLLKRTAAMAGDLTGISIARPIAKRGQRSRSYPGEPLAAAQDASKETGEQVLSRSSHHTSSRRSTRSHLLQRESSHQSFAIACSACSVWSEDVLIEDQDDVCLRIRTVPTGKKHVLQRHIISRGNDVLGHLEQEEQVNTTTTTNQKPSLSLSAFSLWNADRTQLLARIVPLPPPKDVTVPEHLLQRNKHFRLYSTTPVVQGQRKTRLRRHETGGQIDLVYHMADLSSRTTGVFGKHYKHVLKLVGSSSTRTLKQDTLSMEPHGERTWIVRQNGRKSCAEARMPTTNPTGPGNSRRSSEEEIWISPGADPLHVSLLILLAGHIESSPTSRHHQINGN